MALATNNTEELALLNFRDVVKDLEEDDGILMRFLRANNLDHLKAEESLRSYLKWRSENIYESELLRGCWEPPEEFLSKFEIFQTGLDLEGRPVFYVLLYPWLPIRPLFSKYSKFQFLQFIYYCMTTVLDLITKKTKHQQFTFILDNQGLGFTQFFYEVMKNWVGIQTVIEVYEIFESRFPETLNKGFFLNTHKAVLLAFSLVKHFLTERTLSKISIYGSAEDQWQHALHECLPKDAMPEVYGGTAKLISMKNVIFDGKKMLLQ